MQITTVKQAKQIAGTLSKPSKMPGYGYGLPAKECNIGSNLVNEDNTICNGCYANKGNYLYGNVQNSQYNRLVAIRHPQWVDAMVFLISHCSKRSGTDVFRWHDSGDIQDHEHMDKIVEIAIRMPEIKFWCPTREVHLLRTYPKWDQVPDNLIFRVSAIMRDTKPPRYSLPVVLPTSTVHSGEHKGKAGESIVCRSNTRGGVCASCRACWSPKVKNVSYPAH